MHESQMTWDSETIPSRNLVNRLSPARWLPRILNSHVAVSRSICCIRA